MVVTRIAPSPTGKFHIGTARTALFSYLFARQKGGKFLLRIEDTDRARSSDEHIADIKESLEWLGLKWDNKDSEHYQSKRIEEYCRVAQALITKGHAYEKEGAIYFKIQNPKSKIQINSKSEAPKADKSENLNFTDLVHGAMSFDAKDIEDFVILKSDGWPTFHLAVVVDDHDMGVTHVIRGDDHLSNTPKHILLYSALGWDVPAYAHLPLILNANRTKMSKRCDPVSITDDFKKQGFLPEAMVNFLALLGWNPKTEEEFFTLNELVKRFDIKGVQKSNAVFDSGRLRFFNAHYLRQKSPQEVVKLARPLWEESYDVSSCDQSYLEGVAQLVAERSETVSDLAKDVDYFFSEPKLDCTAIVFKKSTIEATQKGLSGAIEQLNKLSKDEWAEEKAITQALARVVGSEKLGNGDVFWPVRYGLSGALASPKPEELLAALGKEKSLRRLRIAEELIRTS